MIDQDFPIRNQIITKRPSTTSNGKRKALVSSSIAYNRLEKRSKRTNTNGQKTDAMHPNFRSDRAASPLKEYYKIHMKNPFNTMQESIFPTEMYHLLDGGQNLFDPYTSTSTSAEENEQMISFWENLKDRKLQKQHIASRSSKSPSGARPEVIEPAQKEQDVRPSTSGPHVATKNEADQENSRSMSPNRMYFSEFPTHNILKRPTTHMNRTKKEIHNRALWMPNRMHAPPKRSGSSNHDHRVNNRRSKSSHGQLSRKRKKESSKPFKLEGKACQKAAPPKRKRHHTDNLIAKHKSLFEHLASQRVQHSLELSMEKIGSPTDQYAFDSTVESRAVPKIMPAKASRNKAYDALRASFSRKTSVPPFVEKTKPKGRPAKKKSKPRKHAETRVIPGLSAWQ